MQIVRRANPPAQDEKAHPERPPWEKGVKNGAGFDPGEIHPGQAPAPPKTGRVSIPEKFTRDRHPPLHCGLRRRGAPTLPGTRKEAELLGRPLLMICMPVRIIGVNYSFGASGATINF